MEYKRVTLEAYRIEDNGYCAIKDNPDMHTNVKVHVYDSDAVSSYPSNTVAINLSKETTRREIKRVGNILKSEFKTNNINLIFGSVNAVSYCSKMLNFPTLENLNKII